MLTITRDRVESKKEDLIRRSLTGVDLPYLASDDHAVDDKESGRLFVQSIEDFVSKKAHDAAAVRTRLGVPEGLSSKAPSAKARAKRKYPL